MLMTTRYMPAVPKIARRADPWPSWQDVMVDALEDFNYWTHRPKRVMPALAYCEHKMAGVSYCALPARKREPTLEQLTIDGWLALHKRPVPKAITRRKPLPRPKGRLERWLDAHRGALAFWRKKPAPEKPKAAICSQCGELIPPNLAWEANEHGKILCGKCWLEQESWAR